MYLQDPGDNAVRVEVDGKEFFLDVENITLQQGIALQSRLGMPIDEMLRRFNELIGPEDDERQPGRDEAFAGWKSAYDETVPEIWREAFFAGWDAAPAAPSGDDCKDNLDLLRIVQCWWWLMRAQSGIREPIAECDGPMMKILPALMKGLAEANAGEEDAGPAEPDPTRPSSPPDDPLSPGPSTPKATTPRPRARKPAAATAPG